MRYSPLIALILIFTPLSSFAQAPFCGDQVVTPPETCDDGNSRNGDGCSSTCELDATIELIPLTGGVYLRGDARFRATRPVSLVTIDDFSLSRAEITQYQYKACVDANVCAQPRVNSSYCNWGKADRMTHPMNCVSWDEAVVFGMNIHLSQIRVEL